MKVCTKCSTPKALTDFFLRDKTTGRLHAQCKDCYKIHRQEYYAKHYNKYKQNYLQRAKLRREKLRTEFHANMLSYLTGKNCQICGENDIRTLEFDHIDPTQKIFEISQTVKKGYGWANVLEEINKCRILCANCHKKHTADQFNWYKNQ